MRIIIAIIIGLLFVSCENEVGRIDLLKNNPADFEIELKKGETLNLYTDMDIEYREKPQFVYDCEFYLGDVYLFKGGTDPLLTTENQNESLVEINGIKHWKYYGKLEGNLTAEKDGKYVIKTTFVKNNKPELKINKAEIIFLK